MIITISITATNATITPNPTFTDTPTPHLTHTSIPTSTTNFHSDSQC